MHALVLLLALTTSTLVLRSGDRITVEGPVKEENGVITFRVNGLLYSMPASEVVAAPALPAVETAAAGEPARRRLKVSAEERARRLRELEQNHSGQPAPPTQRVPPLPPPPTDEEVRERKREEREWRRMAREHGEAVRRAKEEVQLAEERIERLQSEIRTLFALGYKPNQFTYQTTQLQFAKDFLPALRLEVERAERARAQFLEDARREGVLPGWLR